MKMAERDIVIGRAPQPGSVRVLTGVEIRENLPEGLAFDIPALVIVRRQQFPIEPEAVKEALKDSMAGRRIDFSRAEIRVPGGFFSRTRKPDLELLGLTQGFDRMTLIATLRCRERSACGRFIAEITLPDRDNPLNGDSLVAKRHSKILHTRALPSPAITGPFLVQPGTMAWLIIEDSGIKITQTVMPLKKARAGEIVRVSDPVMHRVLLAQVAGERLLRPARATVEAKPERTR
jgi:hypothetical protein